MIWRLTYCNKEGVQARLDIIRGASTPVEVIEGTATPFILNYKMDKPDKSGHIMSSSADISIFETPTFNIDNLKTSSETEIKVEHYINSVLDWSGFVIPDFFSKTIGTPATVEMVASDRLGTLKGVTLDDLSQYVSMRDLAVACLARTGLTLPLYTMADFGNNGQTNAFFKALGLSSRLSDTKGRNISCYDILKSILVASNSKLVQQSGAWYIVNKWQHEQGIGNLFSTLTASTAYSEQTVNFSDVHVGARRTIIPVAATTGVFQEFGGGRSYPDNFDFRQINMLPSFSFPDWTKVGTFNLALGTKNINGYNFDGQIQFGTETVDNYFLNSNTFNLSNYLQMNGIHIPYTSGQIEVIVDVNATAQTVSQFLTNVTAVKIAVGAIKSGSPTLWLNNSGVFVNGDEVVHNLNFGRGFYFHAQTQAFNVTGVINNPDGYSIILRIYGSKNGSENNMREVAVHFAKVSFKNTQELPKGNIFKRNQGTGFTKEHDIDTSIFGDYMRKGLDGYFYEYRIDDTSSLYSTAGTLTEPLWTAHGDTEQLPLLRHVTRQKSRMFSVAHNMISAKVDVATFKPLNIFVDCNSVNPRHVVVSASYDFLRSEVEVELEQIAYATLDVREYIYSYFGEGESGVKSIGGISSGTGGGGSGGGMTADQVAILSEVQVLAHDHGNKEVLDQVTQDVVDNALREMIISTDTETELTDENYLSSLRVLKEILDNNEYLRTQFLSKVNPDTAQEIIKFVKGIEIGTFTTGPLGAGAAIKMENGVSRMEVDQLDVRMRATFRELIIESLKHIGGQLILSPARMKCTSVVNGGTYYKCYFDTGDGKVSNEFVAGDQARCQVFTGSGVKMYWRLVTSVGTDWINLSKTDAISGSSIPEAGDDIVQLGHRTDTTRQNAQILSTVGVDAPSWKQYKGINSFSLEGKDTTVFSGTGNKIDGKTVFTSNGANVEDGINSKNSNYISQPTSYKANDTWTLSSDTTVNGIAYKSGEILTATQDSTTYNQAHWVKKVRYTDDTAVNNLQISSVNLLNNSCDFRESGWNGGWASNAGGYAIDGSVLWNGKPTLRTTVGTGLVHSWLKLENNVEYTYCAMVRTNEDVTWGSGFTPLHYHAGYNNQNQSKINVLKFDTNTLADKWKLIYIIFKLTGDADSFRPHIYRGSGSTVFNFAYIGLVKGNRPLLSPSLSESDKQKLSDEARQTGADAQAAANAANTAVGNLNTYVEGSFKDGVIEASEAKAIEKYINIVNTEKSNLEATYNTLYTNTYLEGTPKTNLLNAKVTYFGAVDTLLASINMAITDGKTTIAEKQAVDTNYSSYKTALASLQTSIENANKAIQAKLDALSTDKVNNLQIGSSNLINDYKFSEVTATSYPWWLVYGTTIIITGGRRLNANSKMATKKTISAKGGDRFIVQVVVLAGAGEIHFEWGNPGWQPAFLIAPLTVGLNTIKVTAPAGATYILPAIATAGSSLDLEAIQVEAGDKPTTIRESEDDKNSKINAAKLTAEQAQLAADGYMRARYIRDWASGSSANMTNHWVEIKVLNKAGTNLASGKTATSNGSFGVDMPASNITDNNTSTFAYITNTVSTAQYAKIDLGQVYYDIDYIQIWHYYQDGRTYYGTKTEISVDGVNWTPVFDSAKSGTYKETAEGNVITQRYASVMARLNKSYAVADKFGFEISGGLVSTVMMLLRELNSAYETAGISGIQNGGYAPAYWSGGTYQEALAFSNLVAAIDSGVTPIPPAILNAKMANIVHLHNGTSKSGELIINMNGNIYTLKNGIVRFELNSNDLPYISSLRDQSEINRTAYNDPRSFSVNSDEYIFPNSIEVVENNSSLSIQAQIEATAFSDDNPPVIYSTSVFLYLIESGGRNYATVGFVFANPNNTNTNNINKLLTGVPKGIYRLKVIYNNSSGHYAASGYVSASVMKSQFKTDVKRFMIGQNGLMAFYGANKYMYLNENENIFFGLRGITDIPGVLLSGRVNLNGGFYNVWGAKKHASLTAVRNSVGYYTVYHSIEHSDYSVQITPGTDQRNYYVASYGDSSFTVYFRNLSGALSDANFSFSIHGKNYT